MSTKNKDIQQNVLLLNIHEIASVIDKNDRRESSTAGSKNYEDYFTSIKGKNKKQNVILVFAESFSTVDSKRAGWLYDNYPFFDKIQNEGITFSNFMANGCTSETAHIALLQGVEPWQNPLEKPEAAYDKYINYTDSLPDFFNALGYKTTFLSTVTLEFLNQRDFIKWLHFQNIIGEEAFKKEKKYVFDAAPDHVLYNKALELVESWNTQPFFLAMQTVSSHKPYDTPLWTSKEQMFKYVDRNIYAFYQKLKTLWFFDNGILIIVGDHRKMEAIPTEEFKKYGMSSHSRALMTVVGKDIQTEQTDSKIIQHMDIFYSLKYLFGSWKVLVRKDFNNIFNAKQQKRDRGVRYCRFAEKNYAVIKKDGEAYTLRSGMNPEIENYINAFKKYQYQYLIKTGYNEHHWSSSIDEVTLIAHRGDPSQTTDNSLKGFKLAKAHRANGVEFDTTLTKDGKIVVYHWPSMATTICNKKKYIYDYTFKELQTKCSLKNGEHIILLEDLLKQIKWRFEYYFIEIKVYHPDKAEQQTLDTIAIINDLWMQDKVIFTSYDKLANYMIGSYTGIKSAWDTQSLDRVAMAWEFPHPYFLIDKAVINEEVITIMKKLNKKLVAYTINTEDEFNRLYDMGVRIMMTDNVPLLQTLIK